MADVFSGVLDIAIAAGWIVLAVVVLRLIFYKTSNAVKCAMWGMVALRLLVPVLFESSFAIVPSFSVQKMVEERRAESKIDNGSDAENIHNTGIAHDPIDDNTDRFNESVSNNIAGSGLIDNDSINPENNKENDTIDSSNVREYDNIDSGNVTGNDTIISGNTNEKVNADGNDDKRNNQGDVYSNYPENRTNDNTDNTTDTTIDTTIDTTPDYATDNTREKEIKNIAAGQTAETTNSNAGQAYDITNTDAGKKLGITGIDAEQVAETKDINVERIIQILGYVWIAGMIVFLAYGVFSSLKLRDRLKTAIRSENEKAVYYSEYAASPFVFGVINPVIYMGFGLSEEHAANVIAHERTHIRRKDHIFKLLAYVLLTVYWFIPWVWLAFILYCRDMELACDEAVVSNLDNSGRAGYSQTLLEFAKPHRSRFFCPVYFGESDIKRRIKNIAEYRKKPVWIAITAAVVCIVVGGILFFTASGRQDAEDKDRTAFSNEATDGDSNGSGSDNDSNPADPNNSRTEGNSGAIDRPSDTERMAHIPSITVPGVISCDIINVLDTDASLGKIDAGDYREWFAGRPDIEKEPAHLEALYLLKHNTEKGYTVYLSGDGKDIVIVDGKEIRYLKDVNWDNGRLDSPGVEKTDADGDGDEDFVIILIGPRGTDVSVNELIIVETVTEDEALNRIMPGNTDSDEMQRAGLLRSLVPTFTEQEYTLLRARPADENKISYVWKASNVELCNELSSRVAVGYMPGELGYALDDQVRGWVSVENGYNINLLFEESNHFRTGVKSLIGEQITFGFGSGKLIFSAGIGIFDKTGDGPNGPLGWYVYDYSPDIIAEIEFSYENGFRLKDAGLYFYPSRNWSYEADIIHSDMIDKVLFNAFGSEYNEKTATYGFGDIDKDGNPDYAVVARDTFSDEYEGYVAFYLNRKKIYEYHHPYLKLFPYEARYADIDRDGENEIYFSMYTNEDSEDTLMFTVLKQTGDGWKELEVAENPFPENGPELDNTEVQQPTAIRKTFADWYTDESTYDFTWEGLSERIPDIEEDYGSQGVLQAYMIAGKGHAAGMNTLLLVLRDGKDRKAIVDYAVLPGDMPGYLWKIDIDHMDYDENYADNKLSEIDPSEMREMFGRELYIRQGAIYQGFFSTSFYGRVYVNDGEIILEPDPEHYITYQVHYNPYWNEPAQDMEGEAASITYSTYDELISIITRGLKEGFSEEQKEELDISNCILRGNMSYEVLGYMLRDIDGDGVDELLLGENAPNGNSSTGNSQGDSSSTVDSAGVSSADETGPYNAWDSIIYDMFTMKDGEMIHVFSGWDRNRYYLCNDGMIANEGSSSAANSSDTYYRYSEGKLDVLESVFTDWKDNADHWYHSYGEPYGDESDEIERAEGLSIREKYVYQKLNYIHFAEQ